jgi:acyl-coenzyme A thioesterase PaaI-like protein
MRVRMDMTEHHLQVLGRVHGGRLAPLLNRAMALCGHRDLPDDGAAFTLDIRSIHVSFVASCREGVLTSRRRMLSQGIGRSTRRRGCVRRYATLATGDRATYRLDPRDAADAADPGA